MDWWASQLAGTQHWDMLQYTAATSTGRSDAGSAPICRVNASGKRWSHRRRRLATLAGAELALQLVSACLFLAPNASLIVHECTWFSSLIAWSAFVRWALASSRSPAQMACSAATQAAMQTLCSWGSSRLLSTGWAVFHVAFTAWISMVRI